MFNKKFKERIKQLESGINDQARILGEKESELRNLQQRLYYAEGKLAVSEDLIKTLRAQVSEELNRSRKIETSLLQLNQSSQDKFKEQVGSLFDEDEDIVRELHKEYEGVEGEL